MPSVAAILWRKAPSDGIEIYLAQRAPTMSFLPGQWSFPGGGVSRADDSSVTVNTRATESAREEPAAGGSAVVPRDRAEAIRMAALVRELLEETGLELTVEPGNVIQAGRLITPEFAPMRFDAWFYLVAVDRTTVVDANASGGELIDGVWVRPAEAMERWRTGEWVIPPPTRLLIEALEPGIEGAAERCRNATSAATRWLRAFELIPGVFKAPLRTPTLPPATHTNCYLLGTRDLLVVDPASPYEYERKDLDHAIDTLTGRGYRVVEIWLTHHHVDHVGGAAHLRERLGVPVAAHPRTAELLAARVTVDRTLADGETIDLAGHPPRRLRVVYTPGHAPGHICIFEEHSRFLIAGDMVAGVGTIIVEPSEGDMALYLHSLERMKELAPRALLPAHGPDIVAPGAALAKLDQYIEHRLWREDRVLEALHQLGQATPGQLVAIAYRDVPRHVYPLAERSLIAHLIKLAGDGRARRADDSWCTP
ncbi:MAG: MBL fold metallo-hydrolase [Proteobacteria bacterium]|nr:MBL fold metallo-hydrolase [Pseudomonadota bacterium]